MVSFKVCWLVEGACLRLRVEVSSVAGDGLVRRQGSSGGEASITGGSGLGKLLLSNNALHPASAGAFLILRG